MAGLAVGSEVAGCRIDAVAGEGGMGIVYVATQLRLNRRVALKVIAPDLASQANFRERFKSESLLAASIEHPNVIPVYEAGETDGLLYLVMRYVEGTDLRELLDREGRLEPARAAGLMAQVGAALSAAHRQGLVHRDVKPANVLVVTDPRTATSTPTSPTSASPARPAPPAASPAPARWWGRPTTWPPSASRASAATPAPTSTPSAACSTRCSRGEVPFPRDSEVATMFAHANAPVPSLSEQRPDVPAALVAVVERCMAKDPGERYPDAGEMARATADAVESAPEPPVAAPVTPPPTTVEPVPPPLPPAQPPAPAPTPPQPLQAVPQSVEAPPQPDPLPPPEAATTELPDEKPAKRLPVAALAVLLAAVVAVVVLILVLGGGGARRGEVGREERLGVHPRRPRRPHRGRRKGVGGERRGRPADARSTRAARPPAARWRSAATPTASPAQAARCG